MLVAGVLTIFRDVPTGLLVVALFAVPNIVGWMLWKTRRFSCYASTQIVIAMAGVFGLLSIYLLTAAGVWYEIQSGPPASPFETYGIIVLVFGGLMVMFYLRFGRRGAETSID
ncbi:MAG: hypothetical protein MPN21_23235 [Thermoanaerobaculia bacterium]|nr:hypothetical protein [Thermoanaerobaculia bacterium]